ncbi:Uncharacterised protein [Wolbachia endosymbiont wPip_Mol of Culex molestus]|uniref:hypothetical protein n=1 Tax=unclassified Wolbachia TaxID=2640676 RepID=UPI0001761DC7|nr:MULTISPECIES: hypothetical protein [unclassified Wolbachia]CAQ54571.1 hypothetical protein WP0463 [Wolbachia endosymbiont of Culex quinquefasciatus Pel]CQD07708.1 Uncharacterised protein [Wolbachia endosymbiont wPip_Mol of Culex molestus]
MWVVLAYSKITIIKSSYVSHGRPTDSKEKTSHGQKFWLLKVTMLLKLLVKYVARLIIIYLITKGKIELENKVSKSSHKIKQRENKIS